MLELKNIHKSFGDVRVLNGTNLRLEKGFVYTLKGGNGSGKTTLAWGRSCFYFTNSPTLKTKLKQLPQLNI